MKAIARKDFLSLLAKSKTSKRRRLLTDWADKADIDAISEISLNTLNGNVKLTPQMRKKLKRHRDAIRMLATKRASLVRRKNLVKQHGGWLSSLIPIALATVTTLVPELVRAIKKKK